MDDHYSTIEAGRLLGLATRSVQLMVDRGELEAWKTSGGHRRISKASVDKLLQARESGMGKPQAASAAAPVKQARKGGSGDLDSPTILLIEDSQHFQRLIAAIVEESLPKASLTISSDGITGLATFGRIQPDLLLVDIMLPGIDGAALITALGRDPMFSASRVIVVTSLDEKQREPFAYALKGLPIVPKAKVPIELPNAIRTALAQPAHANAKHPGR
ncbi:hypothetical protein BH10PSE17_BH10PSE17_04980 [soil metagenome]